VDSPSLKNDLNTFNNIKIIKRIKRLFGGDWRRGFLIGFLVWRRTNGDGCASWFMPL